MIDTATKAIETRIEGIDVDEMVRDAMTQKTGRSAEALAKADGATSGSSPAPSGSIPDR